MGERVDEFILGSFEGMAWTHLVRKGTFLFSTNVGALKKME